MAFVVVAGLVLPVGFLAAELTGQRPVGGAVLLAGLAACVLLARAERVRPGAQAAVVATALLAFVLSHTLGRVVPAAAAVLLAGGVVAVAAAVARDRARSRRPLSETGP